MKGEFKACIRRLEAGCLAVWSVPPQVIRDCPEPTLESELRRLGHLDDRRPPPFDQP